MKIRLKEIRNKHKMNQNEVAKKLEITQGAYSNIERGARIPDAITLNKLADLFNCTIDYILGRTDNEQLAILEGDDLPEELRNVGIEYLEVSRLAQKEGLSPNDIKEIIKTFSSIKNK